MARLRFASRAPVCATVVLPVEDFSANGQQCLNRLCQPRGQAQLILRELTPDDSRVVLWVEGAIKIIMHQHGLDDFALVRFSTDGRSLIETSPDSVAGQIFLESQWPEV